MLVNYSQQTTISRAVADTFSGEKPCCLCKQIAKAKSEESGKQPKPIQISEKHFQDFIAARFSQLKEPEFSPVPSVTFAMVTDAYDYLNEGPNAPPPRV
jgi:hypothetical protein